MKNAPILDSFLQTSIEQKMSLACIDLSGCTGMDSTFMGLLAGYSRILSEAGGKLVIVNPTAANLRLLDTLGVNKVVAVVENSVLPTLKFVRLSPSQAAENPLRRMALIKRAHQNLMKISDANVAKFSAFLTALEKDLIKLGDVKDADKAAEAKPTAADSAAPPAADLAASAAPAPTPSAPTGEVPAAAAKAPEPAVTEAKPPTTPESAAQTEATKPSAAVDAAPASTDAATIVTTATEKPPTSD
jgi:anti-anti-sigma regulatory factor